MQGNVSKYVLQIEACNTAMLRTMSPITRMDAQCKMAQVKQIQMFRDALRFGF